MQKLLHKILPIIIIFFGIYNSILPQNSMAKSSDIKTIFAHFESGIKTGAVKDFFDDLSSETYISLETGISSHFSANQSFYILKEYLQKYKPVSFRFIRKSPTSNKPYAIGKLIYNREGIKGESQVFVSLNLEENMWKIYQITIN